MARFANVNILCSAPNSTGAADILYNLKQTLKSAGWTVLMSSDGTTYNASGDQISTAGSGAGGMNNNSAWFRITDPSSAREFVMQRNSTGASYAVIKYSRQTKFGGGSPSATQLPTTGVGGDGVVIVGGGGDVAAPSGGIFHTASVSAARIHIIAESSPVNGVYTWYATMFQTSTNALLSAHWHDYISPGSCSDSDNDKSYFACANSASTYNNLFNSVTQATDIGYVKSWYKYGLAGANFDGNNGITSGGQYGLLAVYDAQLNAYRLKVPNSTTPTNPYDAKDNIIPLPIFSSSGFMKGFSGQCKAPFVNRAYPELLDKGTSSAYIYMPLATSPSSRPSLVIPWTTENIDPITSS